MLLPIGDTPKPPGTPYVNYGLIGANVAVFLLISLPLMYSRPDLSDPLLTEYLRAMGARGVFSAREIYAHISAYDLFIFHYGFRPAAPSLVSLFATMFLHGGWLHLIGNMLFLWIFGDNVEHRLGHVGYLLVYLGAGIVATLFFALFALHSQVPLIGASGAISGVLGCYYLWYPRNKVKIFIFLFPFIITVVRIPARYVLGFFLLIDNLVPFLVSGGAASGVAHGAHIGGFLAGLATAFALNRLPAFRRLHPDDPPSDAQAEELGRRLQARDPAAAAAVYGTLGGAGERALVAGEDLLAVGDFLLEHGDFARALVLYRRFIAERPNDRDLDRAYLGAGKAALRQAQGTTAAAHYFLSALDVARSPQAASEARGYLARIEAETAGEAAGR
jgi:membrane associated rhomboid family serine protease